MSIIDPLGDILVDRNGMCRWSEVANARAMILDHLDGLALALEGIARQTSMDGVTAIRMRAIARATLKEWKA